MQSNQAFITMFRRIPPHLHEFLILGMATGAEVVMQRLVRLGSDFMVIRGRVSGTQDSGRVIMIPYEQLSYVALTQLLKDPEVEEIFGQSTPAGIDAPAPDGAAATEASPPVAASEEGPTSTAQGSVANGPKKPEGPSKTAVLAKLRERLKETK